MALVGSGVPAYFTSTTPRDSSFRKAGLSIKREERSAFENRTVLDQVQPQLSEAAAVAVGFPLLSPDWKPLLYTLELNVFSLVFNEVHFLNLNIISLYLVLFEDSAILYYCYVK